MRSIDARTLGYGVTSARPYLVTSRTSALTDFPNSPNIGTGEGSVREIFLGGKSEATKFEKIKRRKPREIPRKEKNRKFQ